ncbi:MAG: right-handed parallel beta-helix repeat-containing protein [Bryobacterales bacterium]|nr:right-handed parallel beta-helix repeat-containing protein [Bryobacterales bacterium]
MLEFIPNLVHIHTLPAAIALAIAVAHPPSARGASIDVDASVLQQEIDRAPSHSVLMADPSQRVEVNETIRIDKPLTLVGLNMHLEPGLAKTPILEVLAEGVRIRDFVLEGNGDSVEQTDRAPLIVVRRGRFRIENGQTNNSAKDGIMITPVPEYGDIEHGVVRDLTARDTIRDVVSIGGQGHEGLYVRHLVVENIRSYGSRLRGPVEVSDGSEHITVRDVYAESSVYGVDVQDHSRPGMVNRHILIDGVQVRNCVTAIRTANRDFGHEGLTIRNVTGAEFRAAGEWSPVHIRNTRNVLIENVNLSGGPQDRAWIYVQNSDNVTVRNVTLVEAGNDGAALVLEDADNALVDNIVFSGERQPKRGVEYRVNAGETFGGLRIRNVVVPGAEEVGIVVERVSQSGQLDSYVITDNIATVKADVPSRRGTVERNLSQRPAQPKP